MENSTRTYFVNGDILKFHTVYKDGMEIVEEYSLTSEDILSRKIKLLKKTGKEEWIVEIGEPSLVNKNEELLLKENSNNPIFIRKDTKFEFQWRIRNMNYPKENYLVEIDKENEHILIKTVNKKYYKKFNIPDLKRLKMALDVKNLKVNFQNNTLIISYTKPNEILKIENEIVQEIRKIRQKIKDDPSSVQNDAGCRNQ